MQLTKPTIVAALSALGFGCVGATAYYMYRNSKQNIDCFSLFRFSKPLTRNHKISVGINGIVICGPSGVGKSTIISRLQRDNPNKFEFSVSHTTRAPRVGEVDGVDYHFVTREVMEKLASNGAFLEVCSVHENLYGTSKKALSAVTKRGAIALIEIDVQGAKKIKQCRDDLNLVYVFFTAVSLNELQKRIYNRGSETEEMVKKRLGTATMELKFLQEQVDFFDAVIVNDNLETSYSHFIEFLARKMVVAL